MTVDKKKIAGDCWKKGSEAMVKQNWDYAIDMFGRSVSLIPDNLAYRQSLRGVEERKYNNNKTGKRLSGMSLMKIKGRIKNARRKEDWKAIDQAAEEGLALNPWDAQLNADLGEACSKLGYKEVAVFAYRQALENNPDNKAFNRALALLLEEQGDYAEAIKRWERLHQLDPLDSEARSKITQLEAMQVMDRGGYEDAKSMQDVKTGYDYDRPAKTTIPESVEGPGVSLEADLKRAIRKDETNKDNYLKLADLYRREKRLEEACQMLRKALELTGGNPNIREQLEDTELEQLRHNRDLALAAVKKNPDDETARNNEAALARECLLREKEIFVSRVERYPADLKLKYELAVVWMRLGQWQLAIPLLQRVVSDVRLKSRALLALGKCFIQDNQPKLAIHQLERAIPEINPHDNAQLLAEAHYLCGRLCEQLSRVADAENHYSDVITLDYEYKDARQRLERLQLKGGDAAPGSA